MADAGWGLSRRKLLGVGVAAAGATLVSVQAACGTGNSASSSAGARTEPFYGAHQSGVATAPQRHLTLIALDLRPTRTDPATLRSIMKLWTEDAARLTQGRAALADTEPELATDPARLTVTVGLGPSLFDAVGFGGARPAALAPLPTFATDRLEDRWSGGQLILQLCGDDPLALSHAARVLTKNVRSLAAVRWIQRGYRTPMPTSDRGASMRNLMGQVDGTVHLTSAEIDRLVWDSGEDQPWFAGGTVAVVRRIRTELDTWDRVDRTTKELVVGRRLDNGAPLTGTRESDEPDFAARINGIPVIPENSHIALARHRTEQEKFLRRPYNFDDTPAGPDISDSGLIFIAFQRDPNTQFVPVQQRLADADAFNQWITPIGSAMFAVLPGVQPGEYLGQTLFEAM